MPFLRVERNFDSMGKTRKDERAKEQPKRTWAMSFLFVVVTIKAKIVPKNSLTLTRSTACASYYERTSTVDFALGVFS